MPTPAFLNATPVSKQNILKNPSRLREVHNVGNDLQPDTDSQPFRKITVATGDHASISYDLGDEIESFAEVLQRNASAELFGDQGLLAQYYSIGQTKIEDLSHFEDTNHINLLQQWELECRTWDLTQRIYLERIRDREKQSLHRFSSDRFAEIQYYDSNLEGAEIRVVLDWLRDGSQESDELELRGNRWFYTKESIKARNRLGKLNKQDALVTALDPDATLRQGKRLEDQDIDFERQLLKSLYTLIRSGEFKAAADLCRQAGNHWRAASFQGFFSFNDVALDNDLDADMNEGTINKSLWRRMCYAISKQAGIDVYERALYGALCGDVASVLPVCNSWEDQLWAHLNSLDQERLEQFLVTFRKSQHDNDFPGPASTFSSVNLVLDNLVQHDTDAIRIEAKNPLRMIQARLITGQVDELLLDMHQQLLAIRNGGPPTVASLPHVVRFVTHLILALRQINVSMPIEASNAIIQAYVELLSSAGESSAVALYASYLPINSSIESLALYLATIENEEERKEQLKLASNLGLDVNNTILRTVDIVFEEAFDSLQSTSRIGSIDDELSEAEERCIRALEWLKLEPSLQRQNITLGNTLFRRFLLSGKVNAGRTLDNRMPDTSLIPLELTMDEVADVADVEAEHKMRNAIEYVGYCTLVRSFVLYEDWKKMVREKPEEDQRRAGGPGGEHQCSGRKSGDRQRILAIRGVWDQLVELREKEKWAGRRSACLP